MSKSNSNEGSIDEAIRSLVDRWFNVMRERQDQNSLFNETKGDFKIEVKDRFDELGITFKHIDDQVQIRLDEHKAREKLDEIEGAHAMYQRLYGYAENPDKPSAPEVSEDDVDPLG